MEMTISGILENYVLYCPKLLLLNDDLSCSFPLSQKKLLFSGLIAAMYIFAFTINLKLDFSWHKFLR